MKKFWDWLVLSSKDPVKISLTVKGVLSAAIPFVLLATHAFGLVSVTDVSLNQVANDTASLVVNALTIISLVVASVGFIRKVWNTLSGKTEE